MRRLRLRSAERCPAATPLARVCAGALVALAAQCANAPAWAAGAVDAGAPSSSAAAQLPTDVAGWIARVQRAALERSYVGTFVVTTDAGATSGSRIWHACEGDQHMERIEALDGPARTIFRRNGEMRTFFHASRTVVTEPLRRSTPFSGAVPSLADQLDTLYRAERLGRQRVAGRDADVVWLRPRDALRFGYRIWSEQGSGLVLRLQTVQADGHVREQASFLQLELDALQGEHPLILPSANCQKRKVSGRCAKRFPVFRSRVAGCLRRAAMPCSARIQTVWPVCRFSSRPGRARRPSMRWRAGRQVPRRRWPARWTPIPG